MVGGVESVAVVLLYQDAVKLSGDLSHRCRLVSMAVALVSHREVAVGNR